ncbi:MAG: TRAP transporter large permease subunit [Proteobacteria bacterium]|nr:TRAP transporter large permease subunit [Pseudomonadota bacterium]
MAEFLTEYLSVLMLIVFAALIFTGFPVAFLLGGVGIASTLVAMAAGIFPEEAFYNISLRIFGTFSHSYIFPAVAMLLFMGVALEQSGVSREMLKCLHLLFRRVPGSLAVSVTIIGVLLAPSAGMVGASVSMLTLVALPTMIDRHYPVPVAASAVAAGGTLGLILPPGLMLIFLASRLQLTVGEMFLATVVPGLLLVAIYIFYFICRGALDPAMRGSREPDEPISGLQLLIYVLRSLALPALLIAAVLGSIIGGYATPPQSAAVGAMGSLLLMVLNGSFSVRRLHAVIRGTLEITGMVILIVMAALVFSYPFRFFSGDELVRDFIGSLGFEDWGILITVLVIVFVLGFFIDWIEITVITIPIFFPLLLNLDFTSYTGSPTLTVVWMATLFALILQTSFLTPPFGFALFHIRSAAPSWVKIGDIYKGVMPILALQLLVIVLVLFFPALATHLPEAVFEISKNR